jgi:hypothetical protein
LSPPQAGPESKETESSLLNARSFLKLLGIKHRGTEINDQTNGNNGSDEGFHGVVDLQPLAAPQIRGSRKEKQNDHCNGSDIRHGSQLYFQDEPSLSMRDKESLDPTGSKLPSDDRC